eukprot:TRINITY_DN20365_c0_g1_i1.p1 TRINITY_DN20365_c0_g1~~TRINITY_DN20365_c0_g1_i1.p1  ORF type:complete len:346 (-),score=28.38 TRINITY_DN20365_c0_g1_i1:515-1489(-)
MLASHNRKLLCCCPNNWIARKRSKTSLAISTTNKIVPGKFPVSSLIHMVLRGNPDHAIIKKELNIDETSFFQGTKRAVSAVSQKLSERDIVGLSQLVSTECLDDIRKNILEKTPVENFKRIPINQKDIFLQFLTSLEQNGDKIRITAVTYSFPGMDKSEEVWREYKSLKGSIHESAARTDGILRKQDIDTRRMRKILNNYDDWNMSNLMKKGTDIVVTSYTFENVGDDWKVVSFSQAESAVCWNKIRRYIWKARVHSCVMLDMKMTQGYNNAHPKFITYFRCEQLFIYIFFGMAIYLQYLAFYIGSRYDEEAARRRNLESDNSI